MGSDAAKEHRRLKRLQAQQEGGGAVATLGKHADTSTSKPSSNTKPPSAKKSKAATNNSASSASDSANGDCQKWLLWANKQHPGKFAMYLDTCGYYAKEVAF
jgi:5-hydroxyisourate hydrolase-like protein (transthyretin family)